MIFLLFLRPGGQTLVEESDLGGRKRLQRINIGIFLKLLVPFFNVNSHRLNEHMI